jgi:hypothetical protein
MLRRHLPEQQAAKAVRDVKEAVREFFPEGQMSFPAQMIIVAARKS